MPVARDDFAIFHVAPGPVRAVEARKKLRVTEGVREQYREPEPASGQIGEIVTEAGLDARGSRRAPVE